MPAEARRPVHDGFGRDSRHGPEDELRRLIAGRPALERRVDTLLRLFSLPRADRESFDEIEQALARVGLRIEPPLDGRGRGDVVALVAGAAPAVAPPLRVPPRRPKVAKPRPKPRPAPPARERARPRFATFRKALPVVLLVVGALMLVEAGLTVAWKEPITAFMAARNQAAAADALDDLEAAEARQRRRVLATRRAVRNFIGNRALALNTRIGRGQPVGRLKIDRLDLNFVVVQGTDENSLTKGPAHYMETPLPGTPGDWTVGIAGHRTTYLAPFRHLDDLERGDRIVFTLPYARFYYRVERVKIVDAEERGVMRPQGYDRLALTACHPLYSAAQRIVAFARLKKVQPRGVAARWSRKARGRA